MTKHFLSLILLFSLLILPGQPVHAQEGGGPVYIVQPGDSLSSIAVFFSIDLTDLMTANGITDPNQLGAGIAVAFVATIYGIGSANLLYLPLAGKLRAHVGREVKRREMVIDGLTAIAVGTNPRVIEGKLESYLAEGDA